jgi:DNA replication protein DnaD
MNGTIKNWRKQGLNTLEDIEKGTKKFQSKTQKSNTEVKETSFDVAKAEKQATENPKDFGSMKNKRRKKKEGA